MMSLTMHNSTIVKNYYYLLYKRKFKIGITTNPSKNYVVKHCKLKLMQKRQIPNIKMAIHKK